jgi:hypothetical protein
MTVNCPVCGWAFWNEAAVKRHLASHHADIDPGRAPPMEPASQRSEPKPSVGGWRLVVSYLAAVLAAPIGGVIAGIFLLIRRRPGHGIAVMGIALATALILASIHLPARGSGHSPEEWADHHLSKMNHCLLGHGVGRELQICLHRAMHLGRGR